MPIRIHIHYFFPTSLRNTPFDHSSVEPVDLLTVAAHTWEFQTTGSLSLGDISSVINLEHFYIHRKDAPSKLSSEFLRHLISNDVLLHATVAIQLHFFPNPYFKHTLSNCNPQSAFLLPVISSLPTVLQSLYCFQSFGLFSSFTLSDHNVASLPSSLASIIRPIITLFFLHTLLIPLPLILSLCHHHLATFKFQSFLSYTDR